MKLTADSCYLRDENGLVVAKMVLYDGGWAASELANILAELYNKHIDDSDGMIDADW